MGVPDDLSYLAHELCDPPRRYETAAYLLAAMAGAVCTRPTTRMGEIGPDHPTMKKLPELALALADRLLHDFHNPPQEEEELPDE